METKAKKDSVSMFRNFLWVTFSGSFAKVLTFISSIVTARILFPEDFGIISMAATFSGLVEFSSRIGVGGFIISRKKLTPTEINSTFLTNIIFCLFFSLIMILGAPIAAYIYKTPEVQTILVFSGLSFLIKSVYSVPNALLVKNMRQHIVAKIDLLQNFLNVILIIAFALNGFKYLSFVLPFFIVNIVVCLVYFFVLRWNFSLDFDTKIFKPLFTYSRSFMPKAILSYFVNNCDYIFVGYLLGTQLLGYYFFGFDKALILMTMTFNITTNLFNPMFSKVQSNHIELKKTFFDLIGKQNYILYPLIFLQVIFAKEIIHIVFGQKWDNSILTFKLILVYLFLSVVGSVVNNLFDSIGRPDLNFKYFIIFTPLCIGALLAGTLLGGLKGVSIAAFLIHSIGILILYKILSKALNWEYKRILLEPFMPLLCLLPQIPFLILIQNYLHHINMPNILIMMIVCPLYFAVYILLSKFLLKNLYEEVIGLILKKIKLRFYNTERV